jgi:hypothetical protein
MVVVEVLHAEQRKKEVEEEWKRVIPREIGQKYCLQSLNLWRVLSKHLCVVQRKQCPYHSLLHIP